MPGLALSELTLSHFRSHKTAKIALDGRPVAIFGPNGAGKTNILEAVSLFSPGRGLRRAAADEIARRPEALGWKITGVIRSLGRVHELASWAEPGAPRLVTIDGKSATQAALGRIARMVWLVPSMDRLWTEGADGRRRFLDRITLGFDPNHGENALVYDKAMRERNRLLKDQVRDPHWYGALESQMAAAGCALQASRSATLDRLAAAQDGSATTFPAADLGLTGAEGSIPPKSPAEFSRALADNRLRDLVAGRTLIGPHRADLTARFAAKGVPARQCSTGEQKALLISLILASARALAQDFGAPPILLLDEVAAHLDDARRAALYAEIRTLGAQAWMTGTGAGPFEAMGDGAQRLELTEAEGSGKIVRRDRRD